MLTFYKGIASNFEVQHKGISFIHLRFGYDMKNCPLFKRDNEGICDSSPNLLFGLSDTLLPALFHSCPLERQSLLIHHFVVVFDWEPSHLLYL